MNTKSFFYIILILGLLSCSNNKEIKFIKVNGTDELYKKQFNNAEHLLMNPRQDYAGVFKQIENEIQNAHIKILPEQVCRIIADINKDGKFKKVLILDGDDNIIKIVVKELDKNSKQMLDMNKLPGEFQFMFWFDNVDRLWFEKGMPKYNGLDSLPWPIGGMSSIQKNIHYPESAKNKGIQGVVMVLAKIDQKGNVTDTQILEGFYPECDEEAVNAIRVVKFKPAYKDNIAINSEIVIPISFKLQ